MLEPCERVYRPQVDLIAAKPGRRDVLRLNAEVNAYQRRRRFFEIHQVAE